MFNPQVIKQDFPILQRKINAKQLVYLDNAATSQKPNQVIDAISDYYKNNNANVHRGVHTLSDESTNAWQKSRKSIARFFGCDHDELILVRNTTEALNSIRYGYLAHNLKEGDVVITSLMEHHSNIVAWQEACNKIGAVLQFVALLPDGSLDLLDLEDKVRTAGEKLKLVSLVHVSNTLGTVNPLEKIVSLINSSISNKDARPRIVVDGAQSAPHMQINFHKLGCDFFVFSGHKMLGPMGVGGLIVKKELLDSGLFKPWLFGGGMINEVTQNVTTFAEDIVERFTAGTPDAASAVGLAAACNYLSQLNMSEVLKHDQDLVSYAYQKLSEVSEIEVVGPSSLEDKNIISRVGSVAFTYKGVHAHDVAQILDSEGIAIRSGHHCTMPLHKHFNWQATCRVSFQVYNSRKDIDALVQGLEKVKAVFKL